MLQADEDDFDWEAAVAEIENAERSGLLQSKAANDQARAPRQQTIESFFGAPSVPRAPQEQGEAEPIPEQYRVPIDAVAAKTWIYPANVPRREYQFNITKTALFANTLVSLPTGLGKTLIAAVVIYNFYRWFPDGKIVFTAPSRPLVVQQIEACHNTVGIPQELTIDMTGQISPSQRADLWISKRVFFVTPQVLEKDIKTGICPIKQLVCLVVDEAHRATGNYAYCVAVRELASSNVCFRILALTATPGSNQAAIQDVVNNLNISCLEYRDEDDPDVSQYTHNRQLELIQVSMNAESNNLKDMFVEVLQPIVYKLSNFRVFYHSKEVLRLTPYEFVTAREKFRQAPPAGLAQPHYPEVETCFGLAITLTHILKLLFSHGIKPAFDMLQNKMQQGLLARMMGKSDKLQKIKLLMQRSVSHGAPSPKLAKMEEILLEHFRTRDPGSTRVIIFTNYRDSVKDILESLAKLNGTIKAMEFIGQSAGTGKSLKGQTQKVQQAVLQKFRNGGFNTIVATSIGEEGLDIMEVDLVICFDANISPLRMIQRMGRTGRKRDGRVVVLASEGAETQGYLNKQAKGKAVGKHMRNGGRASFNFHASSRMVPHAYKPEVQAVELRIDQFVPRGRKNKEAQAPVVPGVTSLSEEEVSVLDKYFREYEAWRPSLVAFPHYQLFPTPVHNVKHSSRTTGMLINVLQGLRGLPPLENENADFQENQHEDARNENNADADVDDEGLHCTGDENFGDDDAPVLSLPSPIRSYSSPAPNVVQPSPRSPLHPSPRSPLQPSPRSPPTIFQQNLDHFSPGSPSSYPASPVADFGDSGSPFIVRDSQEPPESPAQVSRKVEAGSNHVCRFSTGIVSVSDSGHVVIAPPPLLRSREILHGCKLRSPEAPADEVVLETPEKLRSVSASTSKTSQNVARSNELLRASEILRTDLSSRFEVPESSQAGPKPAPLEQARVHSGTPSSRETTAPAVRVHPPAEQFRVNSGTPSEPVAGLKPMEQVRVSSGTPSSTPAVRRHPPAEQFRVNSGTPSEPVAGLKPMEQVHVSSGTPSSTPAVRRHPPAEQFRVNSGTPSEGTPAQGNSSDWLCHTASAARKPQPLKRLRRLKLSPLEPAKQVQEVPKQVKPGKQHRRQLAQAFIDEEAEVSTDAEVSEDTADDGGEASEGFIDDHVLTNPQSSVDMLAVYRRSLLTPSPSQNVAPWMRFLPPRGTPGSSDLVRSSAETSSIEQSVAVLDSSLKSVSITPQPQRATEVTVDMRKRKLSFQHGDHGNHSEGVSGNHMEPLPGNRMELPTEVVPDDRMDVVEEAVPDDDLFEGLDLDALEAEAAEKFRQLGNNNDPQQMDDFSPSFDLGI